MARILAVATLILSAFFAPQLRAASPVSATLTLRNDTVLPGVPFDLVVTYTNISDQPVTIGGAVATLVVTFPSGDTKVIHHSDANDQWDIHSEIPVRLAPGESVQQAASWEHGSIPNWFHYGPSFSGPGAYGIALALQLTDKYETVLGSIRTAPVTLNRIQPVGIDAELWKRMQEISGGAWSDDSFAATKPGYALATEIIQLQPSSGYYPYVLALRAFREVVDKNHIPRLLEAADRFEDSPAYPYLLAAAANCARYQGWKALDEADVAEAQKYFTLAESKYREALATNQSVVIRASSKLGMQQAAHGLDRARATPVR